MAKAKKASEGGAESATSPQQGKESKASAAPPDAAFTVLASTTDAEIVKLCKEGSSLRWNFEDFRPLEGSVLDELSRRDLDVYFVELRSYQRRLRREKDEAEFGPAAKIEVLGRSPIDRQEVQGLPDGLHAYWAGPEEIGARKRAGYVTVDKERFPDVVAGDSTLGTQRQVKNRRGDVEGVLMAVPKSIYEGHIQGVSNESTARTAEAQIKGGDGIVERTGVRSTEPFARELEPEKIRVPKGD